MMGRRVVFAAIWAVLLSSCRLGYDLLLTLGPAAGGTAGFGGEGGEGGAPMSSGGSSDASGGADPAGGAPAGGGMPATGGEQSLGGQGGEPPLDLPITALSAGASHTCGLSPSGVVYCWGSNQDLALGGYVGPSSGAPQPVLGVGSSGDVVTLSLGTLNACGLTTEGDVYCWGNNALGALGQGDTTHRAEPALVPLPARAVQVDLGYDTACAIDELSALYCWGANAEGQLGQSDTFTDPVPSASPLEVTSALGWREVSTGNGHVCAIDLSGALYCWGRNTDCQLGVTDPEQIRTPTQAGSDTDWAHVSVGQSQTCAIKEDRSLYCWGANDESQLGIDPPGTVSTPTRVGTDADWLAISIDVLHACGLRDPGTLHCWGRRQEGQLTLPYDPQPIALPMPIGSDDDWRDLTVGRFHTCARRAGSYHCTGENMDGRLGDGTTTRAYGFVNVLPF